MAHNPIQQLRAPLGTFTVSGPHPSRGGNPYSDDMRHNVMTRYHLGLPLDCPELDLLRNQDPPAYPCLKTCMGYISQFQEVGHVQPKKATGNHEAFRDVRGEALPRLALFRVCHPQATIDSVRAFLSSKLRSYSTSQISAHLQLARGHFGRLIFTNESCFGLQTIHWGAPTYELKT